jgi:hypothetical protein
MRTLSLEEAATLIKMPDIASFFEGVDWQYPDPVPSYFLPKDSGAKVSLARLIANLFLDRGPVVVWITEIGIWRSAEHMDLIRRYRLSYGEERDIVAAPIHIFQTPDDRDALISIVSLGLFFIWGFEIMNQDRSQAITVSHDEWLEYRFKLGEQALGTASLKNLDEWMKAISN